MSVENDVPSIAKESVLVESSNLPTDTPTVRGYEWNEGIDYASLLQSYKNSGFQSTNFGLAIDEIKKMGTLWSPSKVIERLGLEIDDPSSIYYWAARNKIPVFSPALTDGSLGDMMYFHSYKNPGLVLDILQDLRRLNSMAVKALNSGMIIIGSGLIKHHICNANLMRNGADYAVFINTASEFDGSDSGARPDEAISWGKIKKSASPVKIYAEASLVFPLLVGETFAKHYFQNKETKL